MYFLTRLSATRRSRVTLAEGGEEIPHSQLHVSSSTTHHGTLVSVTLGHRPNLPAHRLTMDAETAANVAERLRGILARTGDGMKHVAGAGGRAAISPANLEAFGRHMLRAFLSVGEHDDMNGGDLVDELYHAVHRFAERVDRRDHAYEEATHE